ncbi:MAG: 5-(carboxyamino)imidazole ribonucleotide mutase [Dehalococcoidia bacterium]|nr:5-(carboxyamino)imidazole ribonucleotide mutase [Dehalococcoidia bacterium]
MPLVGIIMGSNSDADIMKSAQDTLDRLGVEYEVSVISAHRNPDKVREYGLTARDRGLEVIIAGAGRAAHLPGALAGWTTLPVIGIPIADEELRGIDAQLSILRMPGGIPIACMPLDKTGARNAALFAAEILGLKYDKIKKAYDNYRQQLKR